MHLLRLHAKQINLQQELQLDEWCEQQGGKTRGTPILFKKEN